jgi:hypothetical protein
MAEVPGKDRAAIKSDIALSRDRGASSLGKVFPSLPVFSGLAAISCLLQVYPVSALEHIFLSVFLRSIYTARANARNYSRQCNYSAFAGAISMFPSVARMMMSKLISAPTDILSLVARREYPSLVSAK